MKTEITTPFPNIIGAFNYMATSMALRFYDNAHANDNNARNEPVKTKLEYFNRMNDFGYDKINLFPFLLTVANGYKMIMLDFLNYRFMPVPWGIVHRDIDHYIKTMRKYDQTLNQQLLKVNSAQTIINIDLLDNITSRNEMGNKITDWALHLTIPQDSIPTEYDADKRVYNKEVLLLTDANKNEDIEANRKLFDNSVIYGLIDYCIDYVHHNKLKNFANQPVKVLQEWSTSNSAFDFYSYSQKESYQITNKNFDKSFNEAIAFDTRVTA